MAVALHLVVVVPVANPGPVTNQVAVDKLNPAAVDKLNPAVVDKLNPAVGDKLNPAALSTNPVYWTHGSAPKTPAIKGVLPVDLRRASRALT